MKTLSSGVFAAAVESSSSAAMESTTDVKTPVVGATTPARASSVMFSDRSGWRG
jgi:hypothetical protein